jgi:hypothetical protein
MNLPQPDLAAWRDHFAFLLPNKEFLRSDEVAQVLGCGCRTVLRLFDDASLFGHDINAAGGQRQQMRCRRDSLILFLARRANYAPADMQAKLAKVIGHLPISALTALRQIIGEQIQKRQNYRGKPS